MMKDGTRKYKKRGVAGLVFPVIDMAATGRKIKALREHNGYSVQDIQEYFGFDQPQAIYRWQRGETLPSVDNLYALSSLLGEPMKTSWCRRAILSIPISAAIIRTGKSG